MTAQPSTIAADPLANLDLSDALSRTKRVCTVEILGILEPADLAAALPSQPPPARTDPPASGSPGDIQRIKERHHSVARLIASGLTQRMVAQFSGYSEAYLSTLLDAPAMQDLVGFYRGKYTAAAEVQTERLRTVAGLALDRLIDKIENEDPENPLDPNVLIAAAKLGADRSGNGPTSHQNIVNEHHVFDHAALQKKHQEVRRASSARIIDQTPALPSPPEDRSEGLSDAGDE